MYPAEDGDIRVNVVQFGSSAGTFSGGRPEVNASHAAGTAWGSGAITAASIASDAFTAAKFHSDVTTEFQSGLATASALATVDDFLDTEIAAIKAKTDNLPASPAATGDIPSAASIATAVMGSTIEGSLDLTELQRLFAAALLGKASGLATTTAVYRDTGDSKDRITATVDASGNRSAVTLDAS
jgi:hypothetical protein